MATYTIKVDVADQWVSAFNKNKTKLCFSHGVLEQGDNTATFNVVGSTADILQNIKLTWVDNYEIAAGDQSFSAGTKIEATTDPRPIKFKQSVTLNTSFLLEAPVPAPQLEDGEFELKTKKTASAYLYKEYPGKAGEKGVMKPFYITKDGPNPPGTNVLAPKAVTRLYFAKHVETGTMIDDYQSDFIDIDLTKKTTATVQYNADGAWVQSNA